MEFVVRVFRLSLVVLLCLSWVVRDVYAASYAITIDDPHLQATPLMNPQTRNQRILKHLKKARKRAMLFVCGKRIARKGGKALLRSWTRDGHFLANHSYSHMYFHSSKVSLARFQRDVMRNHRLLFGYQRFLRFFRFPYLKEGNTLVKRDGLRRMLQRLGYRNGHVTIDASDWYVDQRLRKRLSQRKRTPLKPYRDYYLQHMWARAQYYDGLAKRLFKKKVKHTLLIHHNLLNALFLGDLISHFRSKGWTLIDVDTAYRDPLFSKVPKRLPAGESLLWSLAKERGIKGLRYPAESGRYEKAMMDRRGL